jgi:O-antigen/teichoic acid export membrane protein
MLDIAGKSYFLKSVLGIAVFLIVDLLTKDLLISILAMLGVSIIVSIFMDFRISKKLIKSESKIDKKHVMEIFSKGFLVFIISFIPTIIVNVPKYVIDYYLVDKLQAIFGIIIMPATVISLFSQFIIHPMLTRVKKMYTEGNYDDLKKLLYKMMLLILGFGILCVIGAYVLGIPVLELIYGVDLKNYKIDLLIILFAATISTTAGIISPFLIAMRRNIEQVIIGILTIVAEIVLSIILIKNYSISGVVYAYLISTIINFIMYFIFINILLKRNTRGEK